MERKVGEVFNDGEDKIKVVESTNCVECYYEGKNCSDFGNARYVTAGYCVWTAREDETPVKFIKIGESKMDKKEELKRSLAEEKQRVKDSLANVEKMEKQLEELNKKQEQPTVSATGVYLIAPKFQYYNYLENANWVNQYRFNSESDTKRFLINNCFATEEQAEQEALRREGQEFIRRCAMLWNKDHDWRKKIGVEQYYIYWGQYGIDFGFLEITTRGEIYFDTRELAEKCIKELKERYNEEQIKTIFGVK